MSKIPEGYTRVTQILQWFQGKIDIPEHVLIRKGLIGSAVHQAIEADHEGSFFPLNEEEQSYFSSYLSWKAVAKPEVIYSERRFNDDILKISGQVDAIVKYAHSDALHLIDFKTSAQENAKLWKLQAAFYSYLAGINGIELSPSVFFVKLDRNGKLPRVIEYAIDTEARKFIMELIRIYRYFNID